MRTHRHIKLTPPISQGFKPVMAIATKYIQDIQVMFAAQMDSTPHMITTSGEKKTEAPKKEPAPKVEAPPPKPAPKQEAPKSEPVKVPEPAPAVEAVAEPAAEQPSTDDAAGGIDADSIPAVDEAEEDSATG